MTIMFKRLIALALCLVLVVSLVPGVARVYETMDFDNIKKDIYAKVQAYPYQKLGI